MCFRINKNSLQAHSRKQEMKLTASKTDVGCYLSKDISYQIRSWTKKDTNFSCFSVQISVYKCQKLHKMHQSIKGSFSRHPKKLFIDFCLIGVYFVQQLIWYLISNLWSVMPWFLTIYFEIEIKVHFCLS